MAISAFFDNANNTYFTSTSLKNILPHSKISNYIEKNPLQQKTKQYYFYNSEKDKYSSLFSNAWGMGSISITASYYYCKRWDEITHKFWHMFRQTDRWIHRWHIDKVAERFIIMQKKKASISLTFAQVIFCCIDVIKFNKWLQVVHCFFLCVLMLVFLFLQRHLILKARRKNEQRNLVPPRADIWRSSILKDTYHIYCQEAKKPTHVNMLSVDLKSFLMCTRSFV